jgi:hypothetical protein
MVHLDREGDAFRRALDEIRGRPRPTVDDPGPPLHGFGFGAPLNLGPAQGGGGEARWGLAMNWADEPPGSEARLPRVGRPDSAVAADIAAAAALELGIGPGLTADALTKRWRAFVWRNHPDRQPAHARERANARVAVANALYDQACRSLRRA